VSFFWAALCSRLGSVGEVLKCKRGLHVAWFPKLLFQCITPEIYIRRVHDGESGRFWVVREDRSYGSYLNAAVYSAAL
jgi:hypothetical protein